MLIQEHVLLGKIMVTKQFFAGLYCIFHVFTYITNTQSGDLTGKEPHDKIKSERRTETLQKVASHEHNAKNLL